MYIFNIRHIKYFVSSTFLLVGMCIVGTAWATPIELRFTEAQMPLGTNSSVVELTGGEYASFGINVTEAYRYHDYRDPFSDGLENAEGTNPFGLSVCFQDPVYQPNCAGTGVAQIDFLNPVSNLEIDWWSLIGGPIFIDVFNSAGGLLSSYNGVDLGTTLFAFSDISYLTWHDSGGVVNISNIRFDTSSVPEPATLVLMVIALAGLGFARKKAA